MTRVDPAERRGWAFELKCDGFRAIVSTENGLQPRGGRAASWLGRGRERRG